MVDFLNLVSLLLGDALDCRKLMLRRRCVFLFFLLLMLLLLMIVATQPIGRFMTQPGLA